MMLICDPKDRFVCKIHVEMPRRLIFITFTLKIIAIACAILKYNISDVLVMCALNDEVT